MDPCTPLLYILRCDACGFVWLSHSADIMTCPVCDSSEIVVVEAKRENADG